MSTTVRLSNCEACDRLVPPGSMTLDRQSQARFCARCASPRCRHCYGAPICERCLAAADEAEQEALLEEGVTDPYSEWECSACEHMFASLRAPDDRLCDGCRTNDLGAHRHNCRCDRCTADAEGESDQHYWRRASADGQPGR